jgi:hypothetical protein
MAAVVAVAIVWLLVHEPVVALLFLDLLPVCKTTAECSVKSWVRSPGIVRFIAKRRNSHVALFLLER